MSDINNLPNDLDIGSDCPECADGVDAPLACNKCTFKFYRED
jgi:hypothetical protein